MLANKPKMIGSQLDMLGWFFEHTRWAMLKGEDQGATWIELFLGFTLAGGRFGEDKDENELYAKKLTSTQALTKFMSTMKRVVQASVHPDDQVMFAPARVAQRRLYNFGILNKLAAIRALPCWPVGITNEVTYNILMLD